MKYPRLLSLSILTGIALASQSSASTIITGDPNPGGIVYNWTVNLGSSDNAFVTGHVGAWSWQDEDLGTNNGWAHESHWVAVSLAEAAQLTLLLSSKSDVSDPGQLGGFAGGNLFPGITLWSGWDNTGPMGDVYFNKGNVSWAEGLAYFAHIPGGPANSIQGTWTLPAGQYTLAFGGDSASEFFEPRQGYGATLTTAPVPEPASLMLLSLASAPILARRNRKP